MLAHALKPGPMRTGGYSATTMSDWNSSKTWNKRVRIFRVKEAHFDPNQLGFPLFEAREREAKHISTLRDFVKTIEPAVGCRDDGQPNVDSRPVKETPPEVDNVEPAVGSTDQPEISPDEAMSNPDQKDPQADVADQPTVPPGGGKPLPWPRKIIRQTDWVRADYYSPDIWARLPIGTKNIEHQKWKHANPDAAEKAWQEVIQFHQSRGEPIPIRHDKYLLQTEQVVHEPPGPSYEVGATNEPTIAYASYEHNRQSVEFCCSHDSQIGLLKPKDCQVHRLTIDDDLRCNRGLKETNRAVGNNDTPTLSGLRCLAPAGVLSFPLT